MEKPLRILAVVNVPWDPRLGAARVWIELTEEWCKAGHHVEKFCLTDAFPEPAASPGHAALRLLGFPQRAAEFIRENTERFDVIDALIGTLPFSKKSLGFRGLLVARSVGLYRLYEKFERMAAQKWAPASKGKLLGRPFYWFFNQRGRASSDASVFNCDLLNLPNSDELACVRDEMKLDTPAIVQPYGLRPERARALSEAAAPAETRAQKKKIVFIGMWSPRKGARDWGAIIRGVRARVPAAKFLFLGTMIANESVWRDLEMMPDDSIEIVPQFDPDQLPQFVSDCTVGAFPSYVEGFGLAVVEQLAAGLPTVAYDAPGPRDILRGELAPLLVPAGDVSRFAEVLSGLLADDVERYQQLSRQSLETAAEFSWPEIARDTTAEYRKYLSDGDA
ncbi:MAG TPA: glycosyltransferase family 4 protein [Chthoniobacterales bacterium]|nr:glycosyltransferase family 4 protein [Chthoniobacterales bacterium]